MKPEITEPDEYFLIGQDDSRLNVYLRYQLFRALEDHAKRESNREQVGLLVGRESQSPEGEKYVLVEDAVEAPLGEESSGGRFGDATWRRAKKIAAARNSEHKVVGWFHTHLGNSIELTEEERSEHKRNFPEENHLLYVLAAKGEDRNFYLPVDGKLTPARGFRIYGKAPASASQEAVPVGARQTVASQGPTAEQQERHIERKLDKIQSRLQSPPVTPKDLLIIALLVVNACLILFRPNPPVTVDTEVLEREHSDISAQVSSIRGRMEKLEQRLSDIQMLDEQLKLAAGLEEIDDPDGSIPEENPAPKPTAQPADKPPVTAANEDALSGGSGVVKLYKVQAGDSLGVLVDKFYPDSPNGTTNNFAEFNRLNPPNFEIFPGDTLKVPSVQALQRR